MSVPSDYMTARRFPHSERAQSDVPYSSGVTFGIQRRLARRLRSNGLGPQRQNLSSFPQVTTLCCNGSRLADCSNLCL
jgi:hypothetical protein